MLIFQRELVHNMAVGNPSCVPVSMGKHRHYNAADGQGTCSEYGLLYFQRKKSNTTIAKLNEWYPMSTSVKL